MRNEFEDIVEGRIAPRVAPQAPPAQRQAPPPQARPTAAQLSDQDALRASAARLGINPVDYANVISYETLGKFSPSIRGGKANQHIGLIQFGPNEQRQFGAHQGQSFQQQLPAVEGYLKARGLKPGMNIYDLYSTINAGTPGRYRASDRPGSTVASHVQNMLGAHRQKAAAWLGEAYTQPGGAPATRAQASLRTGGAQAAQPLVGGGREDFLGAQPQTMAMQDEGKSSFAPNTKQDFGTTEFDDIMQNGPMANADIGASSATTEFDDILAQDTSTWGGWFPRGVAQFGGNLTTFLEDANVIGPEYAATMRANQARTIGENPLSPADQAARADLQQREGFLESASWFAEEPGAALRMTGESIGQSAVPLIGGAIGAVAAPGALGALAGGMGGMFLGGTPSEIGGALEEALAEQGYDITTPKGREMALANPTAMEYARRQAAAKGLTIGAADAASLLIAGTGVMPAARRAAMGAFGRAAKPGVTVGDELAGVGVQGVMGGVGEAAGGAVSGLPASWPDILAEVAGEGVTGIPEVVLGARNTPMEDPGDDASAADFEAALGLPPPVLALPAPNIPLGDDVIRLPDGTPQPTPTGISPQPATPEDYPIRLALPPPTPTMPPELPPVVSEAQRPTFDEAVAAGRNFFGVARPGQEAAVVDTDYSLAEARATSGDSQVIAVPKEAITAGVTEVVGKTGWISRARSISPDIPVEELVAQVSDAKSYKNAYKQGLRVTPQRSAVVFEPKRWQIQAKMEMPLMREAVAFVQPNGTARKASADVDMRKLVQDKRVVMAPVQSFLRSLAGDAKAPLYAHRMFEVSGEARRTVQSKGWNALFSELSMQSNPDIKAESPAVGRFRSGEIALRPSFANNPSPLASSIALQYAVRGRDANTDIDQVIRDSGLTGKLEVKAEPGAHFGVDHLPTLATWRKPTMAIPLVRNKGPTKPVTVVEGRYVSEEHKSAAHAAIRVIEHFKEKFRIKLPLMIVTNVETAGSALDAHYEVGSAVREIDTTGGHFGVNSRGTDSFIALSDIWSPAEIYDVLMHEFGHYISYTALADASPDVQAQIFAAYRRYLAGKPDPNSRKNNIQSLRESAGQTAYYDTFEEWFAQQIARWGSTNARPMGLVAKFFRTLFNHINEVFSYRGKDQYKNAAVEVETWLDAMVDGKATAFYGSVAREQFDLASAKQNAKHGVVAPKQEENAKLSLLLDKYGSETRQQLPGVNIPHMKPSTRKDIQAGLDHFSWLHKWYANFRQVAARNLHIEELQFYKGYIEQMQLVANRKMMKADEKIQYFRVLRKQKGLKPSMAENQADALFGFAFDMTNMVYRTPDEVKAGVRRQPTPEERMNLARKWGMNKEAAQQWGRIEAEFKGIVKEMVEFRTQKATATIPPGPALDSAIKKIADDAQKMLAAPYFPLTRFGHFAVSVRNKDDKLEEFQTFENPREQKRVHEELKKQYPESQGFTVVKNTLPEDVTQYRGLPSWMLDELKSMPGINDNQRRWIEQFQYEYSPEMSFSKHLMRRKYTPGYSKEGERVYASYMFHYARNYARLLYAEPAREMVKKVLRADREVVGHVDLNKRTEIGKYMDDHLNSVLNPSKDSSALRSIAAFWFLGFNPQSAALNLTQIPVVTLPYLSQHFGDIKSAAALMRGYKDMTKFFKKGTKFGNDLRGQAMKWLQDADLIEGNLSAELSALSSGSFIQSQGFGGTETQRGLLKAVEWSMLMFRSTEKVNRWVTALAAYELAMNSPDAKYLDEVVQANPFDADKILAEMKTIPGPARQKQMRAILAAKQSLLDTQYDYSKVARPRFMRGKWGDLFIFYSFTQNTIMQLVHKKNRGMLLRYSMMMLLFAGTMGLVPDDIEELIGYTMRKTGDKLGYEVGGLETEARRLVAAVLDPEWGDVVMHGAGYYGFAVPQVMQMMGIDWAPLPNFDISGLVGMRAALPVDLSPMFKYADYNQAVAKTAEGLAGAGFGIALNFTNALLNNELQWGDPKLWESVLPASIRNVSRSMRAYSDQGVTNKQGATIVPYHTDDPLHVAELVGYAAGLTPTRISDFYNRQAAQYEAENYWEMKRGILLNRAFRAKMVDKDNDAFSDVVQDIKDFNKDSPDKKFIISGDTLKRSFRMQEKRKRGVETGRDINIAPSIDREIDRLYPNVIEKRALGRATVQQPSAPPVSVP